MCHFRLPLAAVCFFAAAAGLFAQPARGPALKADLWIDPRAMHLDDPKVEEMLEAIQYDRVIISSFVAGTTLLPTKNKIFPQIEYYQGKEELIKKTVARLHARKIKVYAGFDCFRWADNDGSNVFEKNGDLAAVDPHGEGATPVGDKFGSPFNVKARRVLKELAGDFAETLADFDGVFFCPLLGDHLGDSGDPLGFSRADQKALLEETGMKLLEGVGFQREPELDDDATFKRNYRKWKDWRQEKVTSILKELKDILTAKMDKPGLAVQVSADFYQSSLERQNELLEDSAEFIRRVGFDEVVIWVKPDTPKSGANYQELRGRLTREFPGVSTSVLYPVCKNFVLNECTVKSLAGQTVDRVVVCGGDEGESDFGDFEMFKDRYDEPETRYVWPRKDLRDLELDPRLQIQVRVAGNEDPSLLHQFDDLKNQIRVPCGIKFAKPAALTYTGGVGGYPAWFYMQKIAVERDLQGRWEKNADGYDFVVTWPVAEPEKKAPAAPTGFGILWWFTLLVLALATIGGVAVFLKRGKK